MTVTVAPAACRATPHVARWLRKDRSLLTTKTTRLGPRKPAPIRAACSTSEAVVGLRKVSSMLTSQPVVFTREASLDTDPWFPTQYFLRPIGAAAGAEHVAESGCASYHL